jgi:hypothetical protein
MRQAHLLPLLLLALLLLALLPAATTFAVPPSDPCATASGGACAADGRAEAPTVDPLGAPVGGELPPPSPPGTVLFEQTNWLGGLDGWGGNADWGTVGGMLTNDGSARDSILRAPFEALRADYAVEAEIRAVEVPRGVSGFGLVLRIGEDGQYGLRALGPRGLELWEDIPRNAPARRAAAAFEPTTAWHEYRLETHGYVLRALVDGAPLIEASGDGVWSGAGSGLYCSGARIEVRAFRVIAL